MNRPELLAEIQRLHRLLAQALKREHAKHDKLTAAVLRVGLILRKLQRAG